MASKTPKEKLKAKKNKFEVFDHIIIGITFAFFVVGFAGLAFLFVKYGRNATPGGYLVNRGRIDTLISNTIKFDPNEAWNTKQVRVTDRTIILDVGKDRVSSDYLREGDMIYVQGVENDGYIEAVTITVLPPEPKDEEVPIRKSRTDS